MTRTTTGTRLAPLLCLAALGACGSPAPFSRPHEKSEAVVGRPSADADVARNYVTSLAELQAGSAAAQAEVFQAARLAAENAPTTLNKLRFALMVALPGHAGTDPVVARRLLADLVARPELLLPSERALAALMLAEVDARLILVAENRRLQQEIAGHDKERNANLAKRYQAELDENARLRHALDEAQRKLEGVTQVERSITKRDAPPPKP